MRIRLLAVGTKMPDWVNKGVFEYEKRLPKQWRFELVELASANRAKGLTADQAMAEEADRILSALGPQERLILLDIVAKSPTTEQMADHIQQWQQDGQDCALVIGGPDGLADSVRQRAYMRWSLSPLTLPHPLVRVVVVEQLYRAWCILQNHPYHK